MLWAFKYRGPLNKGLVERRASLLYLLNNTNLATKEMSDNIVVLFVLTKPFYCFTFISQGHSNFSISFPELKNTI